MSYPTEETLQYAVTPAQESAGALPHERGVRVFSQQPLRAQCSCSRDAVAAMLKSFAPKDRADMVKDNKVVVTCEFCSSVYEFTPHEAGVEEEGT